MKARWSWGFVAAAALACWMAGCETPPEPSEFTAQLERERAEAVPQVGGKNSERIFKVEPAAGITAAQAAFKNAGVTLVRSSETAEGYWYLGRSLGGRQVVIEVRPVLPGSTVVRVTVEGDDATSAVLLGNLMQQIADQLVK